MEYAYLGCRSYFIMEETTAITFPCLAFFGNLYCFVSQWCFFSQSQRFHKQFDNETVSFGFGHVQKLFRTFLKRY